MRMKTANLIRTAMLSSVLTLGLAAQTPQPAPAEPYRGQTDVPNKAAQNDQPNTALSGNTPQTNSSLQETQSGNMGFELGWLGLLGLAGLLGLGRSGHNKAPDMHHRDYPQEHRG